MIQVRLYIDNSKWLGFDRLIELLSNFSKEYPHELTQINIQENAYLKKEFTDQLPILEIGPFYLTGEITELEIRKAFQETQARILSAQQHQDKRTLERFTNKPRFGFKEQSALWFSRHYVFFFNSLVLIFLGLPFLAPVLMHFQISKMAESIYKVYRPLCHQLAYRSFFLFGEQYAYPREEAGVEGLVNYSAATGLGAEDISTASQFIGNEKLGYKVAMCQRDTAIYMGILLFGIAFAITGKKIKPIPWYIWVLFGLAPIGLDGFSQLISQMGIGFLSWLPVRESTPFLRVITGAAFGVFTAWYGFPTMEETLRISRENQEKKLAFHLAGSTNGGITHGPA